MVVFQEKEVTCPMFPKNRQSEEDSVPGAKKTRKTGRSSSLVPRHRRFSHQTAEVRRRRKIEEAFYCLEKMVPEINDHPVNQDSVSAKLAKASEHVRRLQNYSRSREEEAAGLKKDIERLSIEIHEYQSMLPAVGIDGVDKPPCRLDKMLDKYIKMNIYHNWKFWIFGLMVRPLFAVYNTSVSTSTTESFIQSVFRWGETHLTHLSLHSAFLSVLRQVSTQTSIMSTPGRLPQEIIQKLYRMPSDR